MTRPLIIRPEAEADLAEARAWYERRRVGLGEEFVRSVEEDLDHIRRVPLAATEVVSGVRRVRLRRFPYAIFSLVEDEYISVIAVYHTWRDPRGWQTRL